MSEGEVRAAVSDLAGGRLDQVRLEHHVQHLASRRGAAPPAQVGVATLQALASRATQPKKFVKVYSDPRLQKLPQLPRMVELLEQLAQDQAVAAALRQPARDNRENAPADSGQTFSSPDVRILTEKLLKKAVIASGAQASQKPRRKNTPLEERPYLTNNYVMTEDAVSGGEPAVGPLKNVPVSSQENILVSDLLHCLVGTTGQYIVPMRGPEGVSFNIDPSIDKSLRALVHRTLPVCEHYSTVVSFIEARETAGAGRVNQALVAALELLLQDYRVLVCQLETSWRQDQLSLHQLWYQLQASRHILELLAGLARQVGAVAASGGATLSILHQQLAQCGGNAKAEKILQFLVELAAK